MALIALPVAGMIAAATVLGTLQPSPDEMAARRIGSADIAVLPAGQHVDPSRPPELLPAGSRAEPTWRGTLPVASEGGPVKEVEALGADLAGLGAGMVQVRKGKAPRSDGDGIAVAEALADRLDLQVGDTVTVAGDTRAVVAIVRDPIDLGREIVVVTPEESPAVSGLLVALPSDTDPEAVSSRLENVGWDVITRQEVARAFPEQLLVIVLLGGFGLLVTGLVTGSAFAVSAHRRRHELALLAATGAEPRHLRRSVVGSALLLGTLGAATGLVIGLALAAAALPWLPEWTGIAVDGLVVSAPVLAWTAAVGVLTAVASSWLTARAAGRTPVAAALTGRRPPRTSSARLLVVGTGSAALGLAVVAGAMAWANQTTDESVLVISPHGVVAGNSILTLLGGMLAVPAGLLPVWGLAATATTGIGAGVYGFPTTTVAAVVVVVPALAAVGAWLATRPAIGTVSARATADS
jgi:putative ABC transport system permease protein